ncbi:uncharacterized protein LOC119732306 [Patiria miniata]|uniref:Uncharacterized protein n=1 Tax=Patiria miniata TaxID=46514 RepID=A0A914AD71_PATMI|nr:uncharacterized protein LOC119732306 [Patiria miniata]
MQVCRLLPEENATATTLIYVCLPAGKIPRRGKTKNNSGKRRKAQKVARNSPSKEEAIDKTNKGNQAEDKLVNSRASTFSSAKTTAKKNNQSKGRMRTRRRRHGKTRQKPVLDEADRQTTSDDVKRDPSDALGDSYTSSGKPGKIRSKGKTKKRSGKTRKGQKLAKKSPSEEEAINKTNKGDQAEDKFVNSRDSTVSSSANTTAQRNNQSKGRKKTRKQTIADKKPSGEEKKESQIQLFVISSLRSPVCLQLHPSTTISALKGLLQDKLGIEPKKQRLYTRKNHELKGRMSLKELGIQQDTNIELRLVSGLMGGADDEQKSAGDSRERTDNDSGRRQKGKRKATKRRTSRGHEESVDNSKDSSISSAVKAAAGNPSGETPEEKLEQPTKDISRRRQKAKRKTPKTGTHLNSEENVDYSEDCSISSAVKATACNPSGETPGQQLEQPRKDNSRRREKEKGKAPKTGTHLGGEENGDDSEDSSISSAVKATAGDPSGETQEQKIDQPRKDNDSARKQKEKRKGNQRRTSRTGEVTVDDSEDCSICSAVNTPAGQPSEETQEQKLEQPRKDDDSERRQKEKGKATKTGTSSGVKENSDNSEDSSIASAVKASSVQQSGETQVQQKPEQPRKDRTSLRIQKGKGKAAQTKTSLGCEKNVKNSGDSTISSVVKAAVGQPSGETQEEKQEQPRKDDSLRIKKGKTKPAETRTSLGGEDNVKSSEGSPISSTVKAPTDHPSQEAQEQRLQQPRKDNETETRQKGNRKTSKRRTSCSDVENVDNSEDSSISAATAAVGHPSGEQPRKDDIGRVQKGKRKAANKSPSKAETTNMKSLGDTKQHKKNDHGDSCSSTEVRTDACTSSKNVAGTRKKIERQETAGSEAEESQEKTVASDIQQVDTGSSPASTTVAASASSRSKGRRRPKRKRKNAQKKQADDGGDSQILDLDRPQPEDQNVTGVMELSLQQGKKTALEQQTPKHNEAGNHQEISSETQGVGQEDYDPDKLKADLDRHLKNRPQSSQLQTVTSPEHPSLRCKQDDGLDRPPQFKKQEARSQMAKQEPIEQSCQQGLTVPERQAVKQEQIIDTEGPQPESWIGEQGFQQVRAASPGQLGREQSFHQGIATHENQGVEQKQASHHAQITQQDKHKVAEISKQNTQQSTSPENQRMRQERDDDLYGPDPNIQSTVAEQRPQEEVMTSAQEKPQPDRLHNEKLSPEQLQVVRDLVPSAVQPAMQHPSTLCTHHTSVSVQPTVQTGDVNVPGSCNPVFLGSSSGHTFHYEFNQNVTVHQGATSGVMENDLRPVQHSQPEVSSPSVQTSQGTSPANDAAADAAADLCEEALKKVYKTTGSYVQMIPWVGDDMMHIMDIYTKLRLVTDKLQSIRMRYEGKEVTYEDAFLEENEEGFVINRLIYEGMAGLGKTTLIGKIAYDWASSLSGLLAKYKLVFVLRMSALEQTADLLDSLFEQLIDPNIIHKKHLNTFIFKNPKKVLILLDGFDELMTTKLDNKSFGSILQILNRKVGADIDVVITTRTSHFDKLVSSALVKTPFTHVQVLGFAEEDVQDYLRKFFSKSKSPRDADSLFQSIQSSAVLLDLARSPMLILLMCLLWREDSTLPDTISRLYGKALRYIFKRKGIPEEKMPEILVAIGKVAFYGLISPVQRLSFQDREFDNSVLDIALKAGILTSQRGLKGLETHNNIQFIHKTIQEFCTAVYLQSLQKSDTDEFQKHLDKLDDIKRFHYLLRFCCGDNEACTIQVLQMLQKRINSESMYMYMKTTALNMGLNCYFESQAENLLSEAFTHSVITKIINTDYLESRDDVNSFVWFLKHVANQTKYTGNMYLDKVEELRFSHHSLEKCSKDLAVAMSSMPNISVVRMQRCSLTNNGMTDIASSLAKADKLSELDLSYNGALNGSLHSWMPQLIKKTHLQILMLDDCCLTAGDIKQIAALVGCMPTLVHCTVKGVFQLLPCSTGLKMELLNPMFSGSDVADIVKAVGSRNDIVKVVVEGAKGLGSTAAVWAPALRELKRLEHLKLNNCSLKSTDIEHIVASLSSTTNLVKLDVSRNPLAGSGVSLSKLLQLTQLKKLIIDHCVLNVEDVKWIAFLVGCLPKLIHCTVDDVFQVSTCDTGLKVQLLNQIFTDTDVADIVQAIGSRSDIVNVYIVHVQGLGGTAAEWSPALQELKCLERIDFKNCSLRGKDIEHIAASLSTNLVHLHVSGNPLAGSGVSLSKLKQLTQLKILKLYDCGLEVEDVICIAAVVGCLPRLIHCTIDHVFGVSPCGTGLKVELLGQTFTSTDVADIVQAMGSRSDIVEVAIACIQGLGGTAAEWSPALQELKCLERLDFKNCSLRGKDIEHIAASLSANLVHMHVSRNPLAGSGVSLSKLKQLTQLKILTLDDCGLEVEDVISIATVVGCLPRLIHCTIDHVFGVSPCGTGLKVELLGQTFTGADVADIVQAMGSRSDIVEVYIVRVQGLGGTAAEWSPALQELKCLERIDFKSCSLRGKDIEHIAASLSTNLVRLHVSGNPLAGSGVSLSKLKQLTELKILTLDDCGLEVEDVICIGAVVGCLQKLIHCTVDNVFQVSPCDAGLEVKLLNQTSTGTDVADIVQAIGSRSDIVEVYIVRVQGLGGTAAEWSPALQELKCLERLHFENCSLRGTDIEHIAASLSTSLVHLHVYRNPLAGSGVSLSKLKQLTQLETLTLDDCGLEVEGVISIATVFGCLPKLGYCRLISCFNGFNDLLWFEVVPCKIGIGIRLHLSSSKFRGPHVANIVRAIGCRRDLVDVTIEYIKNFGGKAAEWSPALQVLEHLKRFRISSSSLIDEDIKHIAASLGDIQTLVELDLSGNESLAGSGAWSHLKCLKQLKKLVLSDCRLSDADIGPIAASLSDISTVVELDLSVNVMLAGSGAWSHLKCLKQLKKLVLGWCSLSDADIELIADIPTLVELDLSGNVSLAGTSAWSHLKCLKQLTKLVLNMCWLSEADIELIAASLSDKLVELDLSGYQILADSDAFSDLKCLKKLKKLHLEYDSLSDADLERIGASLSCEFL